jgi:hypothetical protein
MRFLSACSQMSSVFLVLLLARMNAFEEVTRDAAHEYRDL